MSRIARAALLLAGLLLAGCGSDRPANSTSAETQCAEASARVGKLACLHRLTSEAEWHSVSVESESVDRVRSAKYMLPARADARLAPLFVDSRIYDLHYEFMRAAFPDTFPSLTPAEYLSLLFEPARREFTVGALTEYRLASGEHRFGFTIAEKDPSAPTTLTCAGVLAAQRELSRRVYTTPLSIAPESESQRELFASCGLDVIDTTRVKYEAYHRAVGFGTLRRYRAAELPTAVERAELGFRDVLVVDQAPADVETIVSGSITGTRQGPLSHLAVRSASRGTPNCYLDGAYDFLNDWQGKLVRIECGAYELGVREATLAEAEDYWASLRPAPVTVPPPDGSFDELVELDALDLSTAEARALAVRRFGSKGKNLAWLRQTLAPEYTPKGLLIPLSFYLRFVTQHGWQVDLGDGLTEHTFADTLDAWLSDPKFETDAARRNERLSALAKAFEASSCDAGLMSALEAHIPPLFGAPSVTVRFRSSSNAEDGVYFNGAGLYDSYSGCLADDLDGDSAGPSHCDADEKKERSVCRALTRVWASLWNPKAYDERAFYGIDQRQAAMGVLVNERSEDEAANMVVFSGNPTAPDDARYLVNAQLGELAVVSPEPGMWPEQTLLTLEGLRVASIERVTPSSEAPPGGVVLSDAVLRELGARLAELAQVFPFDAEAPADHELLLDSEWKRFEDGSLRIKQVRPFLK